MPIDLSIFRNRFSQVIWHWIYFLVLQRDLPRVARRVRLTTSDDSFRRLNSTFAIGFVQGDSQINQKQGQKGNQYEALHCSNFVVLTLTILEVTQ